MNIWELYKFSASRISWKRTEAAVREAAERMHMRRDTPNLERAVNLETQETMAKMRKIARKTGTQKLMAAIAHLKAMKQVKEYPEKET